MEVQNGFARAQRRQLGSGAASVAGNVIREEMGPYRARDLLGIRAEIKSRGWAGEAKSGGQRREVESFGMALTPTKGWNLTQKLFSSHGGGAFLAAKPWD